MTEAPKFITSEFFDDEFGNWHLKEGAPKEVVEEFNEYMKQQKESNSKGIFL